MSLYPGIVAVAGGPGPGTASTWTASSAGFAVPTGITAGRTTSALAIQGSSWAAAQYTTVASGSPRWERLPDGSVGWLVEGAATNLLLHSNDFAPGATWVPPGSSSISATGLGDPAGGSTAQQLQAASNDYGGVMRQPFALAGSPTVYSATLHVKTGQHDYLGTRLSSYDQNGFVEPFIQLSTGTINNVGVTGATEVDLGLINGAWRRCGHVFAMTDFFPTTDVDFTLCASDGNYLVGNNARTARIWQAQLEASAIPSSPIVTTTAQLTRAADTATGSVSGTDAGFAFQMLCRSAPAKGTYQYYRQIGSGNDVVIVYRYTDGHLWVGILAGGVYQAQLDLGALASSTVFTVAVRVAANNFAASLNHGALVVDTAGTVPQSMSTEYIGHDGSSANHCFGHILGMQGWGSSWYAGSLSDSALIAL